MTAVGLGIYRELLGADGVEQHAAVSVAGAEITVTLRPADGPALAAALERLAASGHAALVRGGGSRTDSGNLLRGVDVVLATDRLEGIVELDAAEGVCLVAAGTRLDELRAVVNAAGWELPLDPPGVRTTVGGSLAAAATGPRALGHGPPRRAVLGLEVALASGERTHCGGRVVKNVTGFDMAKLYTGSFGALGVIESAWLRLRPLPERRCCFEVPATDPDVAIRAGHATSRRNAASVVAVRVPVPGVGEPVVQIELAGDARSVARDADWLRDEWNADDAGADLAECVRTHQAALPGPNGLRFRISVLPSRAAALHAALAAVGAETLGYPGLNRVYAGFEAPPRSSGAEADRLFDCVARAALAAGGHAICEQAPDWVKSGREMFGDVAENAALFSALKQRFDPGGVLNPGLCAGRL